MIMTWISAFEGICLAIQILENKEISTASTEITTLPIIFSILLRTVEKISNKVFVFKTFFIIFLIQKQKAHKYLGIESIDHQQLCKFLPKEDNFHPWP